MEFLYVILLVVIIVMIATTKSSLNERVGRLEYRIFEFQELLKQSRPGYVPPESAAAEPEPQEMRPLDWGATQFQAPAIPLVPPPYKTKKDLHPDPVRDFIPKPVQEEAQEAVVPEETIQQPEAVHEPEVVHDTPANIYNELLTEENTPQPVQQPVQREPAAPELSFFEKHPDLEKFIGENLINKIGIAILVLAIGYFVKFAIDSNWIGPVGRVGIGVLCGGILIGIAHWMRNSYKAFSSVLVGGGIAVLYFTITLAFHQFQLFNQTTSFIILIGITCFAVALSLLYDRQEVAVIALVGGLTSPLMVSTGHANYHGLFIYLVILNAGLLVIAYRKSWRFLNVSTFILTILMFSASLFSMPVASYGIGFLYASILYLLFFGINVAYNVRENKTFIGSDFTILLANTALYFGAGLFLLTGMHQEQFRGLFAVSLAVINLLLSYLLFKNKKVDTNVLYLLIGITLTFISVAGPIQLHGHYITLFWAAETVLLYWLYKKSHIYLMQLASQIIWALMLLSLFMDWAAIYGDSAIAVNVLINKGFITTLFAAVSSYLLYVLYQKPEIDGETHNGDILNPVFIKYTAIVLLFLSGLLEVNHQFSNRFPHTSLNSVYVILYASVFLYLYLFLAKKREALRLNWRISAILISTCIAVYLFFMVGFFDLQEAIVVRQEVASFHFIAHWIGALFIGLLFHQLIQIARTLLPETWKKIAAWVLAGSIVLFLSLEVSLISNVLFYSATNPISNVERIYIKTGLPVLWGLLSFAMMWLGMRHKYLILRIISLSLFALTLVKLFIFDISNIPPAGKIAAFFFLGVILLIISFMYQKVKKIIAADEPHKDE